MRSRTYIVDINSKMYQVARYKQFDNNIDYKIELVEDGVAIDLDNHIVKAFFETKEGIILQKDCTIEGNLVTTKLDNNILALPGKVLAEFTIYHNEQIVTTFTITLEVEKSINKNEAIQKEPVWDIIANLLEIDKTVKAKLEDVDNKLIETTEITNNNTQKIDNKIKEIQNQLDSKVTEKFIEVDDTLNNKFNDKSIEINSNIDNKFAEKSNEIDHKVDNKILEIESAKESMVSNVSNKVKEADTKIADCESRMKHIEDTFDSIVDGTGYAKQEYVDKSLEKKANKDEVYTIDEVDQAIKNIEIDTTPLQNQISENKTDILGLQNELKISENTKYQTINGVKEFECKSGYITNVCIEGETLVNLHGTNVLKHVVDKDNFDFGSDCIKFVSNTQITVFNKSNEKIIRVVIRNKSNPSDILSTTFNPNEVKLINIPITHELWTTRGGTLDNWKEGEEEIYKKSIVILEGNHTNKSIPYFEGLRSVGQDGKIEILTCGNEITIQALTWHDKKFVSDLNGAVTDATAFSYAEEYIDISDTQEYIIYANRNMCFYDKNKVLIPTDYNKSINTIMLYDYQVNETQNKWHGYVLVRPPKGSCFIRVNMQTDKKDKIKMYSKYDKKQILTTLRSINDTIFDELNGNVKIERCKEVLLNELAESEVGYGTAETTNCYDVFINRTNLFDNSIEDNPNAICDKFNYRVRPWLSNDEGIGIRNKDGLTIMINKSKLPNKSKSDIINLFKSDPVRIVYKTNNSAPMTEFPNFNPQTFNDKTTMIISSGVIQADAYFEITNNLRTELNVLKDKVSDLDYFNNHIDKKVTLSPINGFVKPSFAEDSYCHVRNGIVTIHILFERVGFPQGTIFTKIPKEFAPKVESRFFGCLNNANVTQSIYVGINPQGHMYVWSPAPTNLAEFRLNINYPLERK